MLDLFGNPIDWDALHPGESAKQLYALADRERCGSPERAALYALASRYAAKARKQQEKRAAADACHAEIEAETIARIKRAALLVPA
jgi:hypothetical protein